MNWRLWFVQLEGWPVFLVIVMAVIVSMIGLSIVMTHLADRSAVQNAVLALFVLVLGCMGLLAAMWFFSRT